MAKSRMLDYGTVATRPGNVSLSRKKLLRIQPEVVATLPNVIAWLILRQVRVILAYKNYMREHLARGDSQPAVVVSVDPLIVAAYSGELDCVALLSFDPIFTKDYSLQVGSRLLSVNSYTSGSEVAPDLTAGPDQCHRWVNFTPFIADFLSDDMDRITERKRAIDESEWQKAMSMGLVALREHPDKVRNGQPVDCGGPAA